MRGIAPSPPPRPELQGHSFAKFFIFILQFLHGRSYVLLLFMAVLLLLVMIGGGLDARGVVVGLGPAVLGDLLEAVLAEEEALVDVAARRAEELIAHAALEAPLVPSIVPFKFRRAV